MKKKFYVMTLLFVIGLSAGCGREETENTVQPTEIEKLQTEEPSAPADTDTAAGTEKDVEENTDTTADADTETDTDTGADADAGADAETDTEIESDDDQKIDFSYDYTEDIKKEVEAVASGADSLQAELEGIEKLAQNYEAFLQEAMTQDEINVSSKWLLAVWDTELNNLWSRFSDSADQQTKETVLAEQRNWISMKEEVTLLSIGISEENGSMYTFMQNSFLEEITRNRAYILANELAKLTGEAFTMPERSTESGVYVDNQGTDSVYSSLIIRQNQEEEEEAVISIYRLGEIEGTFTDNGNGELAFTANDGTVKGTIQMNGWDGASFTITEASNESIFPVGEEFEFPFVF